MTELNLSEVRRDNSKLRLDSGYFAKPMLEAESLIRNHPSGFDDLGALFSRFVKGIFDINADSYCENGVPFLRILNLRKGIIDDNNLALIPEKVHSSEIKTELKLGDIVLSKTAYPAASLVTLDRCNTCQDTIATTLSEYAASTYKSEFIVAYLNSTIGQRLLWRQFQGNVQLHLSLDDGRKVPIPRLSMKLQSAIAQLFNQSINTNASSKLTYSQAETLLLDALNLADFTPSTNNSNIKSFRESFGVSGRLDAEHYQPKYDQLLAALESYPGGATTIGSLAGQIANGAEVREYQEEGVAYLRVGDVKNLTIDAASVVRIDPASAEKGLVKIGLQAGDVLVSRSGSLAVTAVVEPEWADALISSHLIRLRITDKRIDPYYLALFLGALPGKMQIQQQSNGGVQPEINQPALKSILVPIPPERTQQEIRRLILAARKHRDSSNELLDVAKRAVEIAIEEDEAAALAFIANAQ